MDEAGKLGFAKPKVGNKTLNNNGKDNKEGAKILATSTGGADTDSASKAALILASVSGEEILESIVSSKDSDPELGGSAPNEKTTVVSFAKGGANNKIGTVATPKASAVAGVIERYAH